MLYINAKIQFYSIKKTHIEILIMLHSLKIQDAKTAKNSPSGHHRTTLSGYIFASKALIDNRKNLLNSSIYTTFPYNMANLGPLAAEICWKVWGTPANFNWFRVLAALLHSTLLVGVIQPLQCWTEGATYIWQGGITLGIGPHSSLGMLHKYLLVKSAFIYFNTLIRSSAPVEWLFSIDRQIETAGRNRLSDTNFEPLLLLKANTSLVWDVKHGDCGVYFDSLFTIHLSQ